MKFAFAAIIGAAVALNIKQDDVVEEEFTGLDMLEAGWEALTGGDGLLDAEEAEAVFEPIADFFGLDEQQMRKAERIGTRMLEKDGSISADDALRLMGKVAGKKDEDGKCAPFTLAEAGAAIFAAADEDGSGEVDLEELSVVADFLGFEEEETQWAFDQLNEDDGEGLSLEEVGLAQEDAEEEFTGLDMLEAGWEALTGGDGLLDAEEAEAVFEPIAEFFGLDEQQMRKAERIGTRMLEKDGSISADDALRLMGKVAGKKDEDGKCAPFTLAEAGAAIFAAADEDGSGEVELEELSAVADFLGFEAEETQWAFDQLNEDDGEGLSLEEVGLDE